MSQTTAHDVENRLFAAISIIALRLSRRTSISCYRSSAMRLMVFSASSLTLIVFIIAPVNN
jgi:hypothetical protein